MHSELSLEWPLMVARQSKVPVEFTDQIFSIFSEQLANIVRCLFQVTKRTLWL